MLKVTAIGYRPRRDAVVVALQRAGVLQIEQASHEALQTAELHPDDARMRSSEEELARIQFAQGFLGRYHVNEQPLSTFVSEKFHVERDRFHAMRFTSRHERLYHECVNLSDRLAHGERERRRLTELIAELRPWESLRLQISQWENTERTVLFAGVVPAADGPQIRQMLRETVAEVTVHELPANPPQQAWIVIAHASVVEQVRALLSATPFTEVRFEGLSDYPAEEIARAREQIAVIDREAEELTRRAEALSAADYDDVVALAQALESRRERLTVLGDIAESASAFVVCGWLPQEERATLESALLPFDGEIDVTLAEPGADDEPPVMLRNGRWLKPFEILTDLYGRPRYVDADPTPVLAPFFLLFFAICIGDFGYGAMLVAGAFAIKKFLDVTPGVKKFMDLLILGGFGAMVVGVLLGGYFALPVESLPPLLQQLQVIDPIKDIQAFLGVALLLGVVQVFFGVILAAFHAFRRGDVASAFFDHISVLVLFGSIAVAIVTGEMVWLVGGVVFTMAAQGRAITAALGDRDAPLWDRALGWAWLGCAVWFVAAFVLGGVTAALGAFLLLSIVGPIFSPTLRKSVLGFLGGAYSVYGMTSYAGDILSYLRLAALGLSSTLVGWVFNILAGLVWSAAAPLWSGSALAIAGAVLIAAGSILIFSVGHVFNVVINLLGAFVHPARLQFVEFFSKFYEAGGQPFSPFVYRTENLVLGATGAEREGGSS